MRFCQRKPFLDNTVNTIELSDYNYIFRRTTWNTTTQIYRTYPSQLPGQPRVVGLFSSDEWTWIHWTQNHGLPNHSDKIRGLYSLVFPPEHCDIWSIADIFPKKKAALTSMERDLLQREKSHYFGLSYHQIQLTHNLSQGSSVVTTE